LHVTDEPPLDRWQSGLLYADDTPKSSLAPVKQAIEAVRSRTISACATADFGVGLDSVDFPARGGLPAAHGDWQLRIRCTRACRYTARIERLADRETMLALRGASEALEPSVAAFPAEALPPGAYRFVVAVGTRYSLSELVYRVSDPFTVAPPPPG
jgi:hypothetical protein